MKLIIFNQSGVTRTYLSNIVIDNSSSTDVTSITRQIELSTDGDLRSDIIANNVYISDGVNQFGSSDAIDYLNQIVQVHNPSSDILRVGGQNKALSVTSTPVEAMGGSSKFENRKYLSITPTNGTVYWGYTSGVTISSGEPIFKNQTKTLMFADHITIYLVSAGTVDTRITEGG